MVKGKPPPVLILPDRVIRFLDVNPYVKQHHRDLYDQGKLSMLEYNWLLTSFELLHPLFTKSVLVVWSIGIEVVPQALFENVVSESETAVAFPVLTYLSAARRAVNGCPYSDVLWQERTYAGLYWNRNGCPRDRIPILDRNWLVMAEALVRMRRNKAMKVAN